MPNKQRAMMLYTNLELSNSLGLSSELFWRLEVNEVVDCLPVEVSVLELEDGGNTKMLEHGIISLLKNKWWLNTQTFFLNK